jgi:hypothetical protein
VSDEEDEVTLEKHEPTPVAPVADRRERAGPCSTPLARRPGLAARGHSIARSRVSMSAKSGSGAEDELARRRCTPGC